MNLTWRTAAVLAAVMLAAGARAERFDPAAGKALGPAGGKEDFVFAVMGDNRPWVTAEDPITQNDYFKTNIGLVNASGADFAVNSGDLIRGYAEPDLLLKEWDAYDLACRAFKVPYVNVVGNHDVSTPAGEKIWLERYGPLYFSFDHKGCRFIVLNSEVIGGMERIAGEQLAWLKAELAGAKKARRIFVFLHKPLWAYRPDQGVTLNAWMREVHPLLAAARVDTVFAGHWHQYVMHPRRDGVGYVVTGGGGAEPGEVAGFFHVLRVSVKGRKASYRVVTPDGDYPPEIVTEAAARALRESLKIDPLAAPSPDGSATLTLRFANAFARPLAAEVAVDPAGTSWKTGRQTAEVAPGGEAAIAVPTATGARLFPLPQVTYRIMLDKLQIAAASLYPAVPPVVALAEAIGKGDAQAVVAVALRLSTLERVVARRQFAAV
ncbi:MAG: metallophosphoesterase, partial [bacterium]